MVQRASRSGDLVLCGATIVLAACGIPAFTRSVLTVPLRLSLNYNEGWNAYHVMAIMRGGALYPDSGFFFNNYPPLSFYVVAGWTRLVGDPIVAGRCLSLAAFAVWTLLLERTALMLECRRSEAWFGAMLFAVLSMGFSDYVGINDPQFLGHAVQGASLLLLLRRPRTDLRLLISALLLSAGVFTKQNLIALPIACVAWLMWVDRRAARRLIAMGAVIGIAGMSICLALFHPDAVIQGVAPRHYLVLKAAGVSLLWIARMIVCIATLFLVVRALPGDEDVRFCALYAGVAGLLGCVLSGGDGINRNVLFDGDWALCLGAAVSLNRIAVVLTGDRGARIRVRLIAAYLAAPIVAVAINARPEWRAPRYWLSPHAAAAAAAGRDIEFLRRHEGPALCEELALCFWSGKPVEVDIFNTQQRIRAGWRGEDQLVGLVETRHFGVVQTDVPPRPLGPRFADALQHAYRVDHGELNERLLVPR
jgi:hypothetical protein